MARITNEIEFGLRAFSGEGGRVAHAKIGTSAYPELTLNKTEFWEVKVQCGAFCLTPKIGFAIFLS